MARVTITQSITIDRPVRDVFRAKADPWEIIKHFLLDRVETALRESLSSGQVEGTINKLKLLKGRIQSRQGQTP